jgi:hypothetical protein
MRGGTKKVKVYPLLSTRSGNGEEYNFARQFNNSEAMKGGFLEVSLQLFVTVYFTCIQIYHIIHTINPVLLTILVFQFIFVVVLGWWIVIKSWKGFQMRNKFVVLIESIWLAAISVSFSLNIILMVQDGHCEPQTALSNLVCTQSASRVMPETHMTIAMVLPSLLPLIVAQDVSLFKCQMFSWMFAVSTCLLCMLFFDKMDSAASFGLSVLVSLSLLYFSHVQRRTGAEATQQVLNLTEERDHLLREHLSEMKSVVGNMAHDLKTVSLATLLCFSGLFACLYSRWQRQRVASR